MLFYGVSAYSQTPDNSNPTIGQRLNEAKRNNNAADLDVIKKLKQQVANRTAAAKMNSSKRTFSKGSPFLALYEIMEKRKEEVQDEPEVFGNNEADGPVDFSLINDGSERITHSAPIKPIGKTKYVASGKYIIAIHINWLINRYNDLAYQLQMQTNKDPDLQTEFNDTKAELEYLTAHDKVDQSLKDIIKEFLTKSENNENLDKPNPECYFLRAELCRQCLRYEEALEDYLYGMECISRDKTLNVADYRMYFNGMLESIQKSQNVQGVNVTADDNWAAQISFAYGFSSFWEGKYNEAVIFFTDAIIENETAPIYWYYRALAWKRLGVMNKANKDATRGAHVEKRIFGKQTPVVGYLLQRVQGEERNWLEYKRIGYK